LLAEHGLALWIDTGECRALFDTGQGLALAHNAAALGVNLGDAHAVLLSHGHYDHGGGLHAVLPKRPGLDVYLHADAIIAKLSTRGGTTPRPVGIPQIDLEALVNVATPRWTLEPTPVGKGLMLTGPIPRVVSFEEAEDGFLTDTGILATDPLTDDQAAFLETKAGTVVILGCAHAGVVNTLRHVRALTGGRRIHAVIGGMHLGAAGDARIDATLRALLEMGVARVAPAHCTGLAATAALMRAFGAQCAPARVGEVYEFDAP
jgi:7,8-dihydropterin-6-yl-methyl-4-(beta-D-ribofuranosyl)aminobenzene 5'-phosphate synthase